jgi:hypothetical protein
MCRMITDAAIKMPGISLALIVPEQLEGDA